MGNKTHPPPVRRVVKAFHFRKRAEPKFDHPQTFTRQVTMTNYANPEKKTDPHDDDSKHDLGMGSSNVTQISGSLQEEVWRMLTSSS